MIDITPESSNPSKRNTARPKQTLFVLLFLHQKVPLHLPLLPLQEFAHEQSERSVVVDHIAREATVQNSLAEAVVKVISALVQRQVLMNARALEHEYFWLEAGRGTRKRGVQV
jgi:hypothetical protein